MQIKRESKPFSAPFEQPPPPTKKKKKEEKTNLKGNEKWVLEPHPIRFQAHHYICQQKFFNPQYGKKRFLLHNEKEGVTLGQYQSPH